MVAEMASANSGRDVVNKWWPDGIDKGVPPPLQEKSFILKLSGDDVYATACYILIIVKHSCRKLHCRQVSNLFFYNPRRPVRGTTQSSPPCWASEASEGATRGRGLMLRQDVRGCRYVPYSGTPLMRKYPPSRIAVAL